MSDRNLHPVMQGVFAPHMAEEAPSFREVWERKARWNGFGAPLVLLSDFNRDDEDESDVTVAYTYSPGCDEQGPTYACGGQPAEPAEVEIQAAFTDAGEVELTDAESERFRVWLIENPPIDDEPEYDRYDR